MDRTPAPRPQYAVICEDFHGALAPFFSLEDAENSVFRLNREILSDPLGSQCVYRVVPLIPNIEGLLKESMRMRGLSTLDPLDDPDGRN